MMEEQTEGATLTPTSKIFVSPRMRVTLLSDPDFQVTSRSDEIQPTGADLTQTWEWNVIPKTDGDHILTARVEVQKQNPDGTYSFYDSYTRDVEVHIKVGTWEGFRIALQNAASIGELFDTLFRSWQKTLQALGLLIGAIFGVPIAVREGIRHWRNGG